MARSANSDFKEEKNALSNKPIYLYTIYDYDGIANNLYFAEYPSEILFDGITYSPFPITFDSIPENNKGQIDSVTVQVSNISRLIQSYLEAYNIKGKQVSIKLVWADQLDDIDNYIEDIYYIDSYSADQKNVTFVLTSKFDVLNIDLPFRRVNRNHCSWVFKGTECGYAGGESTCNKTFQRCKELNNSTRFGAFPSAGSQKTVIT